MVTSRRIRDMSRRFMNGDALANREAFIDNGTERLTPLARQQGLVVQKVDAEVLIYDLERHRAHCLNSTAAAIWEHCDGQATIAQIAQHLQMVLHPSLDETVVLHGLRQLSKRHLLAQHLSPGAGLSRRDVLRRVGMAAALTLPVVSSILAPTAAEAATCVGNGASCASAPCCTGCACINGTCTGACL
jgi:hypothetical protein